MMFGRRKPPSPPPPDEHLPRVYAQDLLDAADGNYERALSIWKEVRFRPIRPFREDFRRDCRDAARTVPQ